MSWAVSAQRAVIGARVEKVERVVWPVRAFTTMKPLGAVVESPKISGLGALRSVQLLEVADDDVAGHSVVDGADVGHRHVDQADGRVGQPWPLVAEAKSLYAAARRGGGAREPRTGRA